MTIASAILILTLSWCFFVCCLIALRKARRSQGSDIEQVLAALKPGGVVTLAADIATDSASDATEYVTLASITIPAGSLGPDGRLSDEQNAELNGQLAGRFKP
jgi:hypothetical protein